MNLEAEISFAAKKVYDPDWPMELKVKGWQRAHEAYSFRVSCPDEGSEQWIESKANRFWPIYTQELIKEGYTMNKINDKQIKEANETLDFIKKNDKEVKEVNVEPEVKFVQTDDELGTNDKVVEEPKEPKQAM